MSSKVKFIIAFVLGSILGFGAIYSCEDTDPDPDPAPCDDPDGCVPDPDPDPDPNPDPDPDPDPCEDPDDCPDPDPDPDPDPGADFPPVKADLKVAFTGDTDTTPGGAKVFQMIKDRKMDAVLVAGDLNYSGSNAKAWEDQINQYLGADFPVFVSRGNHDGPWTSAGHYNDRLVKRWDALKEKGVISYSGKPGMLSEVSFQGLKILAVAPSNGVSQADSEAYIRSFKGADEIWRIATWHENMPPYRGNAGCGSGSDLTGWGVYEASREIGAFIVNGHNHVFGRTKLLSCMGGACSTSSNSECGSNSQLPTVASVADPSSNFEIGEGTSFVLLSGMGGHANNASNRSGPWWAAQGGSSCSGSVCKPSSYGSMFCTFNPGGKDPRRADCEYVDVDGKVIDKFTVRTTIKGKPQPDPDPIPDPVPSTGFRLCLTGDTGEGNSDQNSVAKAMEADKCQGVVIAGDVIYSSGISSSTDAQLTKKFFDPYKALMDKGVPVYLTMGNHDYRGDVQPWLEVAAKNPKKVIFPNMWYLSRPSPDICFFGLDSNESQKVQTEWILEEIPKIKNSCKFSIAAMHHPYRSSGHHAPEEPGPNKGIYEGAVLGHVDLAFAGHEHHLEDAGEISGTKHLIAGGGGTGLRALSPKFGWGVSEHGYLRLDVKGNVGTYEFRVVKGATVTSPNKGVIQGKGLR